MVCKRDGCTNDPTGQTMGPFAYLCAAHTTEARGRKSKPPTYHPPAFIVSAFKPRKDDPQPQVDGKCALRGCRKPVPPIAVKEGDSFCSADCCKTYHGVKSMFAQGEGPTTSVSGRRTYTSRECAVCGTPWRAAGGCDQCAPTKKRRAAA